VVRSLSSGTRRGGAPLLRWLSRHQGRSRPPPRRQCGYERGQPNEPSPPSPAGRHAGLRRNVCRCSLADRAGEATGSRAGTSSPAASRTGTGCRARTPGPAPSPTGPARGPAGVGSRAGTSSPVRVPVRAPIASRASGSAGDIRTRTACVSASAAAHVRCDAVRVVLNADT